MIKLLSGVDLKKFTPREYIVADSDKMSIQKIKDFESKLNDKSFYTINTLSRSRKVGQSYITSVLTTLIAIIYSIPLIYKIQPELLLVNGPGTCIPCCFIASLLKVVHLIPKCKIVFTESICRVKNLSLSGKILYKLSITEAFFVQWKELQEKYPKSTYMGRLM